MAQSGIGNHNLAARHVARDLVDLHRKSDSGIASSVSPGNFAEAETKGTAGEQMNIGALLYRLTGLLVLQSLYSTVLDENRGLKAQVMKLEKTCGRLKEQLKRSTETLTGSSTNGGRDRMSGMALVEDGEYRGDDTYGDSLLSPLFKTLQLRLVKLEKMMSGIEGTTAKGLMKQNHDLKQSCQHQQSVIEALEQEVDMYHQLKMPWEQAETSVLIGKEVIVQQLSKYDRLLSIQRTLVTELGIKLEEQVHETDFLQQKLNFEHFGRKQVLTHLSELLNELVLCCLQLPYVAKEVELKAAFAKVQAKSSKLSADFRDEVLVAVQVASDDSSRNSFLRGQTEERVLSQEALNGLSLSQARAKISELQEKLQRLRLQAKNKVIEQMKKYKQASMKLKDLEEKLKKADADKCLVEEQLGRELSRTRAKLEALHQSLGNRSSYVSKAAQSVRALVELLEGQKAELQLQRDKLRDELAVVRRNRQDLLERNTHLNDQVVQIQSSAVERARAKFQGELDASLSELSRLQEDRKTLKERLDVLQELTKRDREARQLVEEKAQRLERQAVAYESQVKEYRAKNAELMESKRQLEAKMQDLEAEARRHHSEVQMFGTRQGVKSNKSAACSVRYVPGEIPRPELVAHKLSGPSQVSSTSFSHRSSEEVSHHHIGNIGSGSSSTLGADIRTQTISPPQTMSGQSARSELFSLTQPGGASLSHESASMRLSLYGATGLQPETAGTYGSSLSRTLPRDEARNMFYARGSPSSRSPQLESPDIDVLQCLRCGTRFLVTNLDDYEKHIQECYSDAR